MRWQDESPPASVSSMVNPIRTSLNSGEGDVRVPPCMRRSFVDAWGDAACGCGVARVSKRDNAVGCVLMEFEVSSGDMCHEPSPAKASMSFTTRDGTGRF
jgi:hypothetical protein